MLQKLWCLLPDICSITLFFFNQQMMVNYFYISFSKFEFLFAYFDYCCIGTSDCVSGCFFFFFFANNRSFGDWDC
jgi:hypothetical protein